jgi:lactoylglutathione lyase
MTLEHVAIWTKQLDELKNYYEKHFGGTANEQYTNPETGFKSYFLDFQSGARLELMSMPGIRANANDTVRSQHTGITHLAFGVESIDQVDQKAEALRTAGFRILRGPRRTGDGYYEFETLDPDNNRIEVTTVA